MTVEALRDHLATKHRIVLAGLKGSKSLTCHVDASKWFQSDYNITVKDPDGKEVLLHQAVRCARRGEDAQIWSGGEE